MFCHFLIDEAFDRGTRWGGTIPYATVERMAQYSKSLGVPFDTWATMTSADPVGQAWWVTRTMAGLDWFYKDYYLVNGDCQTWVNAACARAASLSHAFAPGLHYLDFDRVGTNRYITPSELRHYGGILCSRSDTPFFLGWKYTSAGYAQPGFLDALKYVRDLYASFDP